MPVAGSDDTFTAFLPEVAARSAGAAAAPFRNSRLVGDMLSFCLNPKPVATVDSPPQVVIAFLGERLFELKMVDNGPVRPAQTFRCNDRKVERPEVLTF
jgi:hypothetical protein